MKGAALFLLLGASALAVVQAVDVKGPLQYTGTLTLSGSRPDLSGEPAGANTNRLGGISDLWYDNATDVFYALVDRGPGGGVYDYKCRIHKFKLSVNRVTGRIATSTLLETILLNVPAGVSVNGVAGPGYFTGKRPTPSNELGLSLDPEGFVVAGGKFIVSDEYGPSVYEFALNGTFLRAFTRPDILTPFATINTAPTLDYTNTVNSPAAPSSGRQDNRGFEGLTLAQDGVSAYAVMQGPLFQEGLDANGYPNGRVSPNLRIVKFDLASGQATGQYIYPLDSVSSINSGTFVCPGPAGCASNKNFNARQQGRNIGVNSLHTVGDKVWVLERDNRGLGVDAMAAEPIGDGDRDLGSIGTKKIYAISFEGATDVSNISLNSTNTLPAGVAPVTKTLVADLASLLAAGRAPIAEKFESLVVGPQLRDGSYAIIVATDNDFSVTQDASTDVQTDVCAVWGYRQTLVTKVPLNTRCPFGNGLRLFPTFFYSFKSAP